MKTIIDIQNIDKCTISYYFTMDNNYKVSFRLMDDEPLTFRNYTFKQSSKGQYITFKGKRYYYPYNFFNKHNN